MINTVTPPRISIVTPSFNQGAFLEETIDSVLGQRYPDLEYIIIDGGSTDNSVEIIKKYEKHLKYWVSEKDKGMYDAINKGFSRTTGDIMAWINSDDRYYPGSFSVVSDVFSSLPEVEWIQGNPSEIDEESRIVHVFSSRVWSKFHFYLGQYKYIQQESTFWRRSLWEKSGSALRSDLKYAGDFELWLRFFRYADMHVVKTVIGQFRQRNSNQFSLERLDDYHAECDHMLAEELKNLPADVKEVIAEIRTLNARKRTLLGKYRHDQWRIDQLYAFPPVISYDRHERRFIMGKKRSK